MIFSLVFLYYPLEYRISYPLPYLKIYSSIVNFCYSFYLFIFPFFYYSEPLLQVLVGKVLEQAFQEVVEEEEIKAMREAREAMRERREEEERQVAEEEEKEQRRWEEKERRLRQERERRNQEKVVAEKVASVAFAHDFFKPLSSAIHASLQSAGFFVDPR